MNTRCQLPTSSWINGGGDNASGQEGVNLQLPCVSPGLESASINNSAPLSAGWRQVGPVCGDQSWPGGLDCCVNGGPFLDIRRLAGRGLSDCAFTALWKEAGGPVDSAALTCHLALSERRGLGLLLWRVGQGRLGRVHSLAGVIAPRCPGAGQLPHRLTHQEAASG